MKKLVSGVSAKRARMGFKSIWPLFLLRAEHYWGWPLFPSLDAAGKLPRSRPFNSTLAYYDVTGDGFCTPLDALRVINFLNRGETEGELESVLDDIASDVSRVWSP